MSQIVKDRGRLNRLKTYSRMVWTNSHGYRPAIIDKKKCAARMRKKKTPAEKALWILLKPYGFKSQVILCGYIADFAHRETRLVVEADGAHHNEPETKQYDQVRDWHLFKQGYKVLRFPNRAILANPQSVVNSILLHVPYKWNALPRKVKRTSVKHVFSSASDKPQPNSLATVSREYTVSGSEA